MEEINKLKKIIEEANSIVFFTGAGISVPSGIPDFRSASGIYNTKLDITFSPEEIISHSFFMNHPDYFYDFYFSKMVYKDALPNEAHKYIANLSKRKNVKVVTQNIDGLHFTLDFKDVYEIHGSILRNHCMKCHKAYSLDELNLTGVPRCECGGIIKPDVVLYEEGLDYDLLEKSVRAIQAADVLIVIGTSLIVQPAASLINYYRKDKLVLINKSKTPYDRYANIVINDDIINVIKQLGE